MSESEQPEMVQRVAEALRAACLKEFGSTWSYDRAWAFARAAIEAMREPNDVMLAAGQWTISDNLTVSVCVENNRKAAQIWQAMIGKALLPHQEGEAKP